MLMLVAAAMTASVLFHHVLFHQLPVMLVYLFDDRLENL